MLEQFYGDILPAQGNFCLCLLPEGRHLWADNHAELVALTQQNQGRSGVYFATAAFQSFANRKQTNVLALKALRLDIDAGPEKLAKHGPSAVYATQREAIAAVSAFIKVTKFLPTYLIGSGAGLHVYWCLTDALPPAQWLGYAEALSRLGNEHGLKIDGSVTTDSARVLRPIEAIHHDDVRVSVIHRWEKFYSTGALDAALPMVLAPTRKFDLSVNDELDLTTQGPPSSALKIAQHCGAIAEVAESNGDVQEPFWRAMIGLVKRTVEGIDIAQEWSKGHPSYDPEAVERKFDLWEAGPTTCNEFAKHTSACSNCSYRGKVKSPISLGLMTPEQVQELPPELQPVEALPTPPTGEPWDNQLTKGFEIIKGKDGTHTMVYKMTVMEEDDTGDMISKVVSVPFTNNVFWLGRWAEAVGNEDSARVTLHTVINNRVLTYLADQSLASNKAKLCEYLAGKAIHTTTDKRAQQAMQDFYKANLQRIRQVGYQPKISDRMGMRIMDDGMLVCVHGKYVIYPEGEIREALLSDSLSHLATHFPLPIPPNTTGVWTANVWHDHLMPRAKEHVEFLRKHYGAKDRAPLQLAILMGLASPLMPLVRNEWHSPGQLPAQSSLSVSLYSRETARGKTSVAAAAALAYGHPGSITNDAGEFGSTDNARMGRLSFLGTMPNVMDEMGNAVSKSVAQTISSVANGYARQRLTRDGGLKETTRWSLVNFITTNTSQREMILSHQATSSAMQMRVLEIDMDKLPEYTIDDQVSYRVDWAAVSKNCAGALGAVIEREICSLGTAEAGRLVAESSAKIARLTKADQGDRFMVNAMGAVAALSLILRRVGINIFNLADIMPVFTAAVEAAKEFVAENNMPNDEMELLSRALQDLAPFTLVTEGEDAHEIRSEMDRPDVVLSARIPEIIKVRHIKYLQRSFVAVEALKEWCRSNKVGYLEIIKQTRANGVLKIIQSPTSGIKHSSEYRNLTRGLRADMAIRCKCYEFDLRKLATLRSGAPLEFSSRVIEVAENDPVEVSTALH